MLKVNDTPFEYIVYPGGEVAITTKFYNALIGEDYDNPKEHLIEAYIRNSNDIMALLLLKDIVDRESGAPVSLKIPYFPYARQDRTLYRVKNNQALSVKVMANLINSANFRDVYVYDPHSIVTPALIDRCHVFSKSMIYSGTLLDKFGLKTDNAALLSPDVGALKEVSELGREFGVPVAAALKKRDPATGFLVVTDIHEADCLVDKDVIVVDDICDGGKTFELLVDFLDEKQIKYNSINLMVTHGIFSQGKEKLLQKYSKIHAVYDWTTM